ncbi:ammonia-dependent NAD(+) synthetase [Yaniella halotolerans]|uniref:ammonia-dependent NAD(+) synthetase n=1 Tax=Yaniella halotolerans TaxID=225453 RepID=UPI0003B45B43|nr:ammonia-dependent NAD(+) synthetase [Yaniella halotolerans]
MQREIIDTLNAVADIDLDSEIVRRVNFMVDYLHHTRANGLVLGISGGVDSTVAGRLCQMAVEQYRRVNPDWEGRFYGVQLPYHVQADADDAQAAMDFIAPDRAINLQIGSATDALSDAFNDALGERTSDYNLGNVKARMRMVAQYAVAGHYNALVVGSDQAAESLTGFFTKFGDGSADIMPLSGLTKTQVRDMGTRLGAESRLVDKVPTADLLTDNPGRTDEDELGISYGDIDAFLEGKDIDDEAAAKLASTYQRSKHKRRMPVTPFDTWWY